MERELAEKMALTMEEKFPAKVAPAEADDHSGHDTGIGSTDEFAIDLATEKRVLRKVDLNLMTVLGVLYLMSFLGASPPLPPLPLPLPLPLGIF